MHRALQELSRNPEQCLRPSSPILRELIAGWGNPAWSPNADYLRECVRHALTTPGPVLECGSGLTTLLAGAIAQRRGYRCWSLEHHPVWAERVETILRQHKIGSVTVVRAPLRRHDTFDWYDVPLDTMPSAFALVICDGPPGSTRGGRYGLARVMGDRLAPGCVILLDDMHRPGERLIAQRWATELRATARMNEGHGRYARLVLPAER